MVKEQIASWLEESMEAYPSLFLIDLDINGDQVRITLDGDQGVALKDCVAISRAMEKRFEAEDMDVSLEVSSAGVSSPLVLNRQYKKNIGRKLEVLTADKRVEGKLTQVSDNTITLEWKAREPKPVGKGKVTVLKTQEIPLADIQEAKVKVTF